jgi:predicted secreted protein
MPVTGKINTTLLAIYTGSGAGTKITHLNDCSLTVNHSPRNVSTKDSAGWEEFLEGMRSWEMSASGMLSWDATNAPDDLFTANIATRTAVTLLFTTATTGDIVFSGSAWVTNIEMSSPGQEETATFSASFQGTGACTKGTVS